MKTAAFLYAAVAVLAASCRSAVNPARGTHSGSVVHFAWGTEDFDIDVEGGRLLVSAQDRRPVRNRARLEGAIWQLEMVAGRPGNPREMTREGRDPHLPFHPVGISIYTEGRRQLLFIINRDDEKRTRAIERYEIDGDVLRFERAWRSPFLRSPNDILALGPDHFYVSNDGRFSRKILAGVEKLLKIPLGNVTECRGDDFSVAVPRLSFANGLAVDQSKMTLYVAEFNRRRIHVLSGAGSGRLWRLREPIELNGFPDNLLWEDSTHLIVASHGSRWKTFRHLSDPSRPAPTIVYRIDTAAGSKAKELFADDGTRVSAGSTALVIDRHLVISHLVGNGLFVRELDDP